MPDTSRDIPLIPRLAPDSSIKIIGLGGVGGIVARYGAMFLASLNVPIRLVFIDGDKFESTNATRMFFSSHGNKAAVLRNELLPRFQHSSLSLIAVEEYITPDNISRLIQDSDIIILCVDNHATRKLVDSRANTLSNITLLSSGNDGVGPDSTGRILRGTFGNVQVHIRRDGKDLTPAITQGHPEIRNPADHLPTDKSCTELVASTPQILFANLQTAAAALNTLLLHLCGELNYGEVCFDIAEGRMAPIPLPESVRSSTHP